MTITQKAHLQVAILIESAIADLYDYVDSEFIEEAELEPLEKELKVLMREHIEKSKDEAIS